MEEPQIIDIHLHASELMPGFIEPLSGLRAPGTEEQYFDNTLQMLEEHNIKAVISGVSALEWELVKKFHQAAPERIIPAYGFVDINEVEIDQLREILKNGEAQVLGEMGTQYFGLSPSDPILDPVFSMAEEMDIPVLYHMGIGPPNAPYVGMPKYRASLSNPLLLENMLVRHPNLRICVAHAGWPMLSEMLHILYVHPQVCVDIAVLNWVLPIEEFHYYLKRLTQAGYCNRILFGSDQMMWTEAIPIALDAIKKADFLTPEQKNDIFFNNAQKFLKLKD